MRLVAALVASLTTVAAAIDHRNGNASFWIISTVESRRSNESMYITSAARGTGALRSWPFIVTDQRVLRRNKFHLFPVAGSRTLYYLVGTAESRKAGYMAYLEWNGQSEAWPFNPAQPVPAAQWRFIESSLSAEGPSYHIVSTAASRTANEMLFIDDLGGLGTWGYDATDARCLWRLQAAPPSPPLPDYEDVMEEHETRGVLSWMGAMLILCCCCICGATNRTGEQRQRTQHQARVVIVNVSSGRIPIPVGTPVQVAPDPNAGRLEAGGAQMVSAAPVGTVQPWSDDGGPNQSGAIPVVQGVAVPIAVAA